MSAARVIHADRSSKLVRRYWTKAAWARSRRSSTSASDNASNVSTVSPVAGLIVAIAMSVLLAWGRRTGRCRVDALILLRVARGAIRRARSAPGGVADRAVRVIGAHQVVGSNPRWDPGRARRLRAAEAVEALAVPGEDQVAFLGWNAGERGLDGAP